MSPEAKARAQAKARARAREKARARARARARMRMFMYLLVFAVAVMVLVAVIKSGQKETEKPAPDNTTPSTAAPQPLETTATTTAPRPRTSWDPVTFTAEDARLNSYREICRCEADYQSLLLQPLNWDLTESDAKVLIIHSHISEAYTQSPGNEYEDIGEYRTDDKDHNMTAIGDRVTEILKASGVEVIHDTTDFEVPNTDYAYQVARESLQQRFQEDSDIVLVLDLHRDAALTEEGTQWGPTIEVDGKQIARISFAVGTNCRVGSNEHWKDNMALTLKLQAQLEKMWPGITREILVSSSHYNQDLPNNFMLVEVGAAGNTLDESLRAAECVAKAILELSSGTAG